MQYTASNEAREGTKYSFQMTTQTRVLTLSNEYLLIRENGRDLTQFYDKNHSAHRKFQNATWQQKTPLKLQ